MQKPNRVRTSTLGELKRTNEKFAALTSYDALTAAIFDEAGVEVILVGDSAAETVLGHSSTLRISLEEMASFGRAVTSSVTRALVVIDMPFGSYEQSATQAVESAIKLMKESGAQAVKLEGGSNRLEQIRAIVAAGIPVMGHLGFTPQSVHALGGYKVQGRGEAAKKLLEEARVISAAGVFAIVLELVPDALAKEITNSVQVPTIGIGAGSSTDGQILVWQDFAGLTATKRKFVKRYLELREQLLAATKQYVREVKSGDFPSADNTFSD